MAESDNYVNGFYGEHLHELTLTAFPVSRTADVETNRSIETFSFVLTFIEIAVTSY